jgi:hypothetical protein
MNQIYTGHFYLSAIVFDQWRFFLPEFRIAWVPSKIRSFHINYIILHTEEESVPFPSREQ